MAIEFGTPSEPRQVAWASAWLSEKLWLIAIGPMVLLPRVNSARKAVGSQKISLCLSVSWSRWFTGSFTPWSSPAPQCPSHSSDTFLAVTGLAEAKDFSLFVISELLFDSFACI